jgi:endonuclease YncB( thermonuclease family)
MHKLIRLFLGIALFALEVCTSVCDAQESFPAHELKFQEHFATRSNDLNTYSLLGNNFFRALSAPTASEFIEQWLAAHPRATAIPVSKVNAARPEIAPRPLVYVWIEDGTKSLNVALVEEGHFSAGVMLDMIEAQHQLTETLQNPMLSNARASIEKEIASTPEADRPKRLVSDAEYAEHRERFVAAETKAKSEKKGIWSDEMKQYREDED